MELTLDSCPAPAEHVRSRRLEQEAVVVLPDRGEVKVLNEVGAQIWTLADGSRTVREIIAAVCAEFEASPAVVEADTLEFLAELQHKGLITIRA
jgi:hypothetical protein